MGVFRSVCKWAYMAFGVNVCVDKLRCACRTYRSERWIEWERRKRQDLSYKYGRAQTDAILCLWVGVCACVIRPVCQFTSCQRCVYILICLHTSKCRRLSERTRRRTQTRTRAQFQFLYIIVMNTKQESMPQGNESMKMELFTMTSRPVCYCGCILMRSTNHPGEIW